MLFVLPNICFQTNSFGFHRVISIKLCIKKCAASSLHCLFWQRLVACVLAKVRHCDYVGRVKCSNGKYLNAKNALNRMVNQICSHKGWHNFCVYNWNGYNNHKESDKLCANALWTIWKWILVKEKCQPIIRRKGK